MGLAHNLALSALFYSACDGCDEGLTKTTESVSPKSAAPLSGDPLLDPYLLDGGSSIMDMILEDEDARVSTQPDPQGEELQGKK